MKSQFPKTIFAYHRDYLSSSVSPKIPPNQQQNNPPPTKATKIHTKKPQPLDSKNQPPYLEFTPLGINICFQSGSRGAQIQHEVVYHKPEDISALPVTHSLPKDWGDAVATAGSAKLQLNLGLVFKSRTSHQSSKIPKSFHEVEVGVCLKHLLKEHTELGMKTTSPPCPDKPSHMP